MDSTSSSDSQYFESSPTVASKRQQIELVLPDVYLALTTDTGVFSAGQVDKGTRYLLKDMPTYESFVRERGFAMPENQTIAGSPAILDLGCGYGPIALTMAKRVPEAAVFGVDVNERALGLARENAVANNINTTTFGLAAAIDPTQTFDLIVSNPPIRIGKAALHELLAEWLDRLAPTGRAWLVVQKHLGSDSLANWMTESGWETTRLSSRKGFRILEVLARQETV